MQIYLYGILLASVRLASIFCFRGYKLPVPRSLSSFCLQSNLKIQSVDLTVKDFEESVNFYSQILQDQRILKDDQGLFPLSDGAYFKISRSPSVHYEIGEVLQRFIWGNTFFIKHNISQGFIGIGISKDKPTEILPRLVKDASRIIREFGDYKIGPSLIPDEDDMKQTNVRYGIVSDPSGYQVEINESDSQLRKIVLGVIDLDESIEFYTSVLGMNLFRKRSNVNNTPKEASFSGFVVFQSLNFSPFSFKYRPEKRDTERLKMKDCLLS